MKVVPKRTHIPAFEEEKIPSPSKGAHGENEEYWHAYFREALHRALELEPSKVVMIESTPIEYHAVDKSRWYIRATTLVGSDEVVYVCKQSYSK